MSCKPGELCEEGVKRRRAIVVLVLMAVIFLALSAVSFIPSRGQVVPTKVDFAGHDAVAGKRIFQAYNCMGCHTIVGNGAYFAPDLTDTYRKVGPAWIEAFLPSAGTWPTSIAVKLQLQNKDVAAAAGTNDLDTYLAKFPGAAERISRRGGQPTMMPNLPFTRTEVDKLVAFLRYTSEMNTEGWPPKPAVNGLTFPEAKPAPALARVAAAAAAVVAPPAAAAPSAPAGSPSAPAAAAASPAAQIARGEELAKDNGCTACHTPTKEKLVGPGWGGLYGSTVKLADGKTIKADDAYITEKILKPEATTVAGYEAGVMPSFAEILKSDEVADIVAYIRSLGGNKQ